ARRPCGPGHQRTHAPAGACDVRRGGWSGGGHHTAHDSQCGPGALDLHIHLVPKVLGEIDLLKDQGRTPEVREKAGKLATRIKGCGTAAG
ncbi:MAG: hypothetical protein ACYC6C_14595, partial [Coriobacteriia bacterium]